MEAIRTSIDAPPAKARRLLRLSRILGAQCKTLSTAYSRSKAVADRRGTDHLARIVRRTHELHEEVRDEAMDYMNRRNKAALI